MPIRTREVQLAARPVGEPKESDFRLVETELADPGPGEILVRNLAMSVDPYMRGRMNDVESYSPPWQLDQPADGGAVGEVIASGDDALPTGTTVLHGSGWREHALLKAAHVMPVVTAPDLPASYYLGVLGMPGLTAYAGLIEVAEFKAGESVFVSGAAGAVGSLVGQFARLLGAGRVIGSAGSATKVSYLLDELGFDAAFDYHDGPVRKQLRAAAPDGVDVYFDNVGGEHLEAAIGSMRLFGRIAMSGAISAYNATELPSGPGNLTLMISKRLRMRGFLVSDHNHLKGAFVQQVGGWLSDGKLVVRETSVDGLDQAVPAFIGLLRGVNTGKMIVNLE